MDIAAPFQPTDKIAERETAGNLADVNDSHPANEQASPNGNGTVSKYQDDDDVPVKKKRRKSTSHLKMVPETLAEREAIKAAAEKLANGLDKTHSFTKNDLEQMGRQLLTQMGKPEKFLGFAMVLIGNFFWKKQFMAVPYERRLLLLPHCLKHAEGCPAEYDEFGLDCEKCGACSIADYKVRAEQLGYKVLVAEGSPIVLKIIVEGYVDAILGVACLNVLEKAIDKVLIAGVPSYAIPLHSGDCKNTKLDESWVWDVLEKFEPLEEPQTSSYIPIMRAANRLFTEDFDRLIPRQRSKTPEKAKSPLGITEDVAYDWLANGGKRFRPFITLAAFDAVTGGRLMKGQELAEPTPTESADATVNPPMPVMTDAVARVAMAIEAFHKASLVHDDIQDDDLFRYGRDTLHRTQGLGPAINIGDYLIGMGYRLVNASRGELGADIACDIVDSMSNAHIRLCDGQGAEMAWQNSPDWNFTPLDALSIYALKTSPAFEAALFSGLRMAGSVEPYATVVPQFCRQLGVGFQILNDLKDWQGDANNKLVAGQDALALRPTLLLALALDAATDSQRAEIRSLYESDERDDLRLELLRRLFQSLGVFEKAEALVDKSRARAEALADEVEPVELRQLLYFLVDNVLAEEGEENPQEANDPSLMQLSLSAP
ncbi:MAG: polyprenyl synthetase family protein [Planctomycetaceae bacterium]